MAAKRPAKTDRNQARMGRRRPIPIMTAEELSRVERDAEEFKAGGINREPQEFWRNTTAPRITVTIAGPQGGGKTKLREMIETRVGTRLVGTVAAGDVPIDFIEIQTDAPAGDAMDLAIINAALTEQLQKSIKTGEGLAAKVAEITQISDCHLDQAVKMTERWAAGLCAGGLIAGEDVMVYVDTHVNHLDQKVAAIRAAHASYEWTAI